MGRQEGMGRRGWLPLPNPLGDRRGKVAFMREAVVVTVESRFSTQDRRNYSHTLRTAVIYDGLTSVIKWLFDCPHLNTRPPPPFLKRLCNHYSNGCCLTQQGWRRLSDELNLRRKSVRPSWRWRRARTAWWDPTCCRRSCQAIAENNQFGGQLKDNSWSASG